nr:MAG: minor tail protein [Bacteriophage sp.]
MQGGVPRQGRDTYFEPVPISVTLVVSSLGRQAFYSFLNNIDGGASSFIMPHDTGMGIEDHQVLITSTISDSTDDGKNWVISFTATAERTAIQEDTCLTKNLPDLFGCYGDYLGSFLKIYANYQTTFPRIWSDEGPAGYPPINMLASTLDSRIVYDGPQVYYINRNGNLVQSAANEWPLTFIDGVAAGRVPPELMGVNSVLYSSDIISSLWVKAQTNVTLAPGYLTSDNTFKATPTIVNGAHYIQQSIEGVFGEDEFYTFSCFAKSDGYKYARLRAADGAGFISDVVVNLETGDIYSGQQNSLVTYIGGGWFRFTELIVVRGNGANKLDITIGVNDNSARLTYPGDGSSGILVSSPQIEKSEFATSPIITDSSAAKRQAASAKVAMNGATSIDIAYSDGTVVNVPSVDGYATIPRANSAWGSKYITRIDFNVDG